MEPLQVINSVNGGPYAVKTLLGWTVNGPLRGGSDVTKSGKAVEVTANRTSVAKPEELWQLQFKQDFNAGQDKDIEMSKEDHQLRMVFDCGASFQGTSLNQQLLQGPYLTSSLVGVFVRF